MRDLHANDPMTRKQDPVLDHQSWNSFFGFYCGNIAHKWKWYHTKLQRIICKPLIRGSISIDRHSILPYLCAECIRQHLYKFPDNLGLIVKEIDRHVYGLNYDFVFLWYMGKMKYQPSGVQSCKMAVDQQFLKSVS